MNALFVPLYKVTSVKYSSTSRATLRPLDVSVASRARRMTTLPEKKSARSVPSIYFRVANVLADACSKHRQIC